MMRVALFFAVLLCTIPCAGFSQMSSLPPVQCSNPCGAGVAAWTALPSQTITVNGCTYTINLERTDCLDVYGNRVINVRVVSITSDCNQGGAFGGFGDVLWHFIIASREGQRPFLNALFESSSDVIAVRVLIPSCVKTCIRIGPAIQEGSPTPLPLYRTSACNAGCCIQTYTRKKKGCDFVIESRYNGQYRVDCRTLTQAAPCPIGYQTIQDPVSGDCTWMCEPI